jgi:hypothetical protein
MSNERKSNYYAAAIEGLKSANKHNPLWSKGDAMQLLNLVRTNNGSK